MTFVVIRLAFLLGTALTFVWVLPSSQVALPYGAYDAITDYVFGTFAQWDSDWYLRVADHGYDEPSAAFFPLYPAAVYALGAAIGSNLVAGVLISLAGAATAAWALVQIARPLIGESAAKDTVLLLALYPTAFVFTSVYSEGLFLAFATTSVLAAQRNRPWVSGLLAGFAVGTRSMGLALVPALVALLWPKTRMQIPQLAPVILLPLMGIVSVALTFDLTLDDSLAFVHAQAFWERDPSPLGPLGGVYEALAAVPDSLNGLTSLPRRVGPPGEAVSVPETLAMQQAQVSLWNLVDLLVLAAAAALTVVVYRRLGLALALYSIACLAIATSAPGRSLPLHSMVRLVMVDFPLLMAGAALIQGRPQLRTGVLVTLGAVTAAAGVAFARKLWIA
jgi:hypothetical protein